jgi:hypothetical protein
VALVDVVAVDALRAVGRILGAELWHPVATVPHLEGLAIGVGLDSTLEDDRLLQERQLTNHNGILRVPLVVVAADVTYSKEKTYRRAGAVWPASGGRRSPST